MDGEFQSLLAAVRDGRIRDPERVREIIADARTVVAAKEDMLQEMRALLFAAQEAFLSGWPTASLHA